MVLRRPTRSSRTNTQKRCPFHYRGLECKSRKSRNTWSNRQIWPLCTEWSRAKANRVLPKERTGHSKCPLPTTQAKTLYMDITRWSTLKSDWLYSLKPKMEKLYMKYELCTMPEEHGRRFVTLYRRQGARPSPRKRNTKSKMAVRGGLTNSCEKKRGEKQSRKGKIHPFECRIPKNSKER